MEHSDSRLSPGPAKALGDTFARPLRDLRISVTDRCNFRCVYCMPKEVFGRDFQFLERDELLTFEEVARLAHIFVAHGVQKIRLTGGEPLVRRNVERLVELVARIEGISDLTMTTNGALLASKARSLQEAGLHRITVSLDSLDDDVFKAMNDVGFPVRRVLEGIEAAVTAGLSPVKVNMVVKRGVNEGSVLDMANHFRGTGSVLRFIEYMDVGTTNGWRMQDVVPAAEIVRSIDAVWPLEPLDPSYHGEVARPTAIAMVRVRSGSYLPSHSPSAAPVPAPGSPRTANCTLACSPPRGTTSNRSSAVERPTTRSCSA